MIACTSTAERDTFGDRIYVTPRTCIVFSELAYRVGMISSQFQPTYAKHWCREPKSLYTDRQFPTLFAYVRTALHLMRIRAIVIRNAQWIDQRALGMLLRLREESRNYLSIILCAQMQEQADVDEPLAEEFLRVPEAAEICRRIELQRLDEAAFVTEVYPALLDDLSLFWGEGLDDTDMVDRIPYALWERTQHSWKQINDVAKEIRQQAKHVKGGKLVLARPALEKILKFSLEQIQLEGEAQDDGNLPY